MGQLSKDQVDEFRKEGFIQFKGLFDTEEIELLRSTAHADRELDKHSFSRTEKLLGEVVYHYHSKMIQKDPKG